tara:strand:- start:7200 stop:7724 length:525 start_codon:yes stop_codon:yes gene_type:complete
MSDFSEDKPNVNEEDVVIPEEEEKVEEMSFKEPETNEDYDESSEDEDEDFKKFDLDIKNNKLMDFHPEMKQISYEEMITLSTVVRDKNGIIIDPLHKTLPILTRYEQAKIIGLRAKQINSGSNPLIDIPDSMIDGITIAQEEFKQKKMPFIIRRPLPNGSSEYWKVEDLEILEV